eukprot:Nk52_evm1s504 gene=Nk52_evmTU1s504
MEIPNKMVQRDADQTNEEEDDDDEDFLQQRMDDLKFLARNMIRSKLRKLYKNNNKGRKRKKHEEEEGRRRERGKETKNDNGSERDYDYYDYCRKKKEGLRPVPPCNGKEKALLSIIHQLVHCHTKTREGSPLCRGRGREIQHPGRVGNDSYGGGGEEKGDMIDTLEGLGRQLDPFEEGEGGTRRRVIEALEGVLGVWREEEDEEEGD